MKRARSSRPSGRTRITLMLVAPGASMGTVASAAGGRRSVTSESTTASLAPSPSRSATVMRASRSARASRRATARGPPAASPPISTTAPSRATASRSWDTRSSKVIGVGAVALDSGPPTS